MRATIFVYALPALILADIHLAQAQQAAKVARIGYLGGTSSSVSVQNLEALRQGLHDLGYVEGKNLLIEYRFADARNERFPALAAELLRTNVDVIVSAGGDGARAAQQITSNIPIVFVATADPVTTRLVATLARPGGNVTGQTTFAPELTGKRLELLKESAPKVSRVAVLLNPRNTSSADRWKEAEAVGQLLRVRLQAVEVRSTEDFEKAFKVVTRDSAHALMVLRAPIIDTHRRRVINFAVEKKLPTIFDQRDFVEAGGLLSYGPDFPDLFRRAATYVDKILKGAKPADLPVEQPTKFEFIINLKAAKQIGLTIPPNVLARADKVIK